MPRTRVKRDNESASRGWLVPIVALAVVGVSLMIDDAIGRVRGTQPVYSQVLESMTAEAVDLTLLFPEMSLEAAQVVLGSEGRKLLKTTSKTVRVEIREWHPHGHDVVVIGTFSNGRATQFTEVNEDAAEEAAEAMLKALDG